MLDKITPTINDIKPTKRANSYLRYLCHNITLNIATCCSPHWTVIRESIQSNTTSDQFSHFRTQLTSCIIVKRLKLIYFFVRVLYRCDASWYTICRLFPRQCVSRSITFIQQLYKKNLYFNCVTHLHHINPIQKSLIWFYTVLLCFDSLMLVPCGLKHVGIFSVILWHNYVRSESVRLVCLMSYINYK
jgi:hypothetical protein